jgi:hypothetical protein
MKLQSCAGAAEQARAPAGAYDFDIKAVNCNSLNIACSPENFALKMDAICNLTLSLAAVSRVIA